MQGSEVTRFQTIPYQLMTLDKLHLCKLPAERHTATLELRVSLLFTQH